LFINNAVVYCNTSDITDTMYIVTSVVHSFDISK